MQEYLQSRSFLPGPAQLCVRFNFSTLYGLFFIWNQFSSTLEGGLDYIVCVLLFRAPLVGFEQTAYFLHFLLLISQFSLNVFFPSSLLSLFCSTLIRGRDGEASGWVPSVGAGPSGPRCLFCGVGHTSAATSLNVLSCAIQGGPVAAVGSAVLKPSAKVAVGLSLPTCPMECRILVSCWKLCR